MKLIKAKTVSGNTWYFEDEGINYIITGNARFKSIFSKTNDFIYHIITKRFYDSEVGYDYDVFEELEKMTGEKWVSSGIIGFAQGEWNTIYFPNGSLSQEDLREIEAYYYGDYSEFYDEDNCYYEVPNYIIERGKEAVCEYLDIDKDSTFEEEYEEIICKTRSLF